MVLANILAAWRRWRLYRATLAELERLPTRTLDDLGIARGDIDAVARAASGR
jgi:uncharacterized protein YjiS (DUF1127 family)